MRSIVSAVFTSVDEADMAAGRLVENGVRVYKRRVENKRKNVNEDEPLAGISTEREAFSLGSANVITGSFPISFAFPKAHSTQEYIYRKNPDAYDCCPRLVVETDTESVPAAKRIIRNSRGSDIRCRDKT